MTSPIEEINSAIRHLGFFLRIVFSLITHTNRILDEHQSRG